MIVISPLPLASKPGTCAATVSVNDSAPRSASIHTAQAVSTLVFEYSSQRVSSLAATRLGSSRASPSVRVSASLP